GEPSERLMEVKMRLATEKDEMYQQYAKFCKRENLFCMVPRNDTLRQDGAGGDSGSGIVAEYKIDKQATYVLQGFTDAGIVSPKHLNLGISMSKFAYDVCAYTGVCTEPEWVGQEMDKSKLKIILNEAYDQSERDPNAKVPEKALQDLKETGEDIRRSEKHAEDEQRSIQRSRQLIEKFQREKVKKHSSA
ncbi:hypothetical protein AAVH_35133, partial [Aphelenchoides avenae]